MGLFYVVTEENDTYELAVTSEIKVSSDTKVSSDKTEDAQVVADNAVANNRNISYNGIVTNIAVLGSKQGSRTSPVDYIEGLESLRRERKIVSCFIDAELEQISNCLITKLDYSKSNEEGVSSWRVALSLQEIRLTDEATSSSAPTPKTEDADSTTKQQEAGNGVTGAKPIAEVAADFGKIIT